MTSLFVSLLLRHAPLPPHVLEALAPDYPEAVLAHPLTSPSLAATVIAGASASDIAGSLRQLAGAEQFDTLALAVNRIAELTPVAPTGTWEESHVMTAILDAVDLVAARAPHLLPDLIPPAVRTWPWVESGLGHYGHHPGIPLIGGDDVAYRLASGRGAATTDAQAAALLNANPNEGRDCPQALVVLLLLRPHLLALLTDTTGLAGHLPRMLAAKARAQGLAGHLQGPCTHQCPYVRASTERGALDELLSLAAMAQVPDLHQVHAGELFTMLSHIAAVEADEANNAGFPDEDDPTWDAVEMAGLTAGAFELIAPRLGGRPPRVPREVGQLTVLWTLDRTGHHPLVTDPDVSAAGHVLAAEVLTELISRHEAPAALWGVVLPLVAGWEGTLVDLVDAAAAVLAPAHGQTPDGRNTHGTND